MTNLLPEYLEKETIELMSPGDVRYTLPWAMFADADRRLWIHRDYPAKEKPGGTCHLRIRMTLTRVVEVDQTTIGDHAYSPEETGRTRRLPVNLVRRF